MTPDSERIIDELLRTAIRDKRLIRLTYQDKERIVEPHDYGVHKKVPKLLAFQIRGASSGRLPGWRWLEIDGMFICWTKPFPGIGPLRQESIINGTRS